MADPTTGTVTAIAFARYAVASTDRTVILELITPHLRSRDLFSSANATIDTISAHTAKPTRPSLRCARSAAPLAIVARSA